MERVATSQKEKGHKVMDKFHTPTPLTPLPAYVEQIDSFFLLNSI